jgi:hypothetical protein
MFLALAKAKKPMPITKKKLSRKEIVNLLFNIGKFVIRFGDLPAK